MSKYINQQRSEGAPCWVLAFCLTLMLTVQVNVKADETWGEARPESSGAPSITLTDGQVLYAWESDWEQSREADWESDPNNVDRHIPPMKAQTANYRF
ncbi:hypothetical protein C9I92_09780 [Photobacterium ganghwense]|uniref:Uncharacterized protein n=1 Tax=Photobacterium ganghwense TaxID=320778 RepID=A0A0J1K7K7_9GAMM|nr:hypothetical protein [Photobacterium ganghwense]KLV10322.1 hypothetical protein ABT57_07120 [Photobacterium ganghwense]PSU09788.1 hypothetical protein C9I92_09780 [Photobacterium ganghwense]QSV17034.1 hypothetical protein FH974_19000 [Photobacterium ganghwense]